MRAARYGEVPPAVGPARNRYLRENGAASLAAAKRELGIASREAFAIAEHAGVSLPRFERPVDVRLDLPSLRDAVVARRQQWWEVRRAVVEQVSVEPLPGDPHARAALRSAVDALNYLEDTELAAAAHLLIHQAGELVGGLYGCSLEHDRGKRLRTCLVVTSHLRVGNSVGFTARRACSLCGGDMSDPDQCAHLPGRGYQVAVHRTETGECSLCKSRDCDHEVGSRYEVTARPVVVDLELHEVSVVPRPRDPLCRCDAIEIPTERMRRELGRRPRADEALVCYECIGACSGFVLAEELFARQTNVML
jgi:hypothetical protein